MSKIKIVDLSKTWYATRKFQMDAKEYLTGDTVDMDTISARQATRLVKYRFVTDIEPQKARSAKCQPEPKTADTPVAGPAPVVAPEPVQAANAVKLKHVGGGYYEAQDAEGENVLPEKVQGKDNAKMICEQLGLTVT